MPWMKNPEVLVVGAGPVGLFTALCLARRGVAVEIVDRDWRPGAHSYALALHRRTLDLLREADLEQQVLQHAQRVDRLVFYRGPERKREIYLNREHEPDWGLAVLPQDALERLLEDALKHIGVHVRWNHEVARLELQDRGVDLTIDQLEKQSMGYATAHTEWVVSKSSDVTVPLVVGADGHRSSVRQALGIQFAQVGPPSEYAVFEFDAKCDGRDETRVVLGPQTTDVLWPLPGDRWRWSFQIPEGQAAMDTRDKQRLAVQVGSRAYPLLQEETLSQRIAERAPWFTGKIGAIHWRMLVRFEQRLAESFGRGRAWLAGDAAHLASPISGWSMNLGLAEGAELAELLAGVVQRQASLETLNGYGQRSLAQWQELLRLEGGVEAANQTDSWIAEELDRIALNLPASGPGLRQLHEQLSLGHA